MATPILAEKSLLDMTEEELLAHHQRVIDRANETREDRALLVLERTQALLKKPSKALRPGGSSRTASLEGFSNIKERLKAARCGDSRCARLGR